MIAQEIGQILPAIQVGIPGIGKRDRDRQLPHQVAGQRGEKGLRRFELPSVEQLQVGVDDMHPVLRRIPQARFHDAERLPVTRFPDDNGALLALEHFLNTGCCRISQHDNIVGAERSAGRRGQKG